MPTMPSPPSRGLGWEWALLHNWSFPGRGGGAPDHSFLGESPTSLVLPARRMTVSLLPTQVHHDIETETQTWLGVVPSLVLRTWLVMTTSPEIFIVVKVLLRSKYLYSNLPTSICGLQKLLDHFQDFTWSRQPMVSAWLIIASISCRPFFAKEPAWNRR